MIQPLSIPPSICYTTQSNKILMRKLMTKTLLTAHSGCDGTQDNSLTYIAYALALNADCLELDIRRDNSGALVLNHDDGPAHATLADAFLQLTTHPEKKLNCDLKQEGLELETYALARQMGVDGQIVFSGTVSKDATSVKPDIFHLVPWFVNIELLFPEIKAVGLTEAVKALGAIPMADTIQAFVNDNGACCLNTHHSIAKTPLYKELMARGVSLSVWTPDDEQVITGFLADAVYNITTRNAKRACEIRREQS